jgi:hypothetical protein
LSDATAPVACTIGADEVDDRVALLERLRAGVCGVERTEHGLRLVFPAEAGLEADVRRFALDEARCCSFWGFEVVAGGGDVTLRWDGPPAVAELLDLLLIWFRGEGSLPPIRELL